MNKYIKSVLTSATLVIAALTLSTTTNAASIRKASTGTIHSRIARTYSYAKKMIKEIRPDFPVKVVLFLVRNSILILVRLRGTLTFC